jgi:hypothetical protein
MCPPRGSVLYPSRRGLLPIPDRPMALDPATGRRVISPPYKNRQGSPEPHAALDIALRRAAWHRIVAGEI